MNKLILILLGFSLSVSTLKANDLNEGSDDVSFFQTTSNPGTGGGSDGDGDGDGDPMDNDDYAPIDDYYPLLFLGAIGLALYYKKDLQNIVTK
ncbi:hypothetical protein [Faecalibacter macacae]|uniref:Signal peptidase n=1 Tax=Faecalibacter macacae TaxID=1859289 RepID=A0A3L9M3M2_9FLAO|nr:hypothetical protein [Faecalibacter macacae]RLZ07113.1 hypothetical protein EAH69_11725 [Faecalibacter macacae]